MAKKKVSFDIEIPGTYVSEEDSGSAKKRKKKAKLSRHSLRRHRASKSQKPAQKVIYREAYGEYKKKLLGVASNFIEQEFEVIVQWIKDLMNVKGKVRAFTFYMTLLIAGSAVLLYGIGKYLDCLCPTLGCGLSFMLVGAAAIIFALLYRRFSI